MITSVGKANRRKKTTDPAKLKACRPSIPLVTRPYEGLSKGIELVVIHKLIPVATMTTRIDADYGVAEFDFVTFLPEGHLATVCLNSRILVALWTRSDFADLSHDTDVTLPAVIAVREVGDEGVISIDMREPFGRPQDTTDIDSFTDIKLGEDFSFWFNLAEEIDNQIRRVLEQNRNEIIPVELVPDAPGAYWCEINHSFMCFLMNNDKTKLLNALVYPTARGEANAGEGSRYVDSFRACDLIVPVFELLEGASMAGATPGTQILTKALKETLKVIERLDDKERRACQGLVP